MIKVINNILPTIIANAILESIPQTDWQWYHRYNDKNSLKYGSINPDRLPEPCKIGLKQLAIASSMNLEFDNDPYDKNMFPDFDYHAGGIHIIPHNGFLNLHLDCEYHPNKNWKRVGSLVWFANKNWKPENGGELILEDIKSNSSISFLPVFNQAIYFDTDNMWHKVTRVHSIQNRITLAIFFWKEVVVVPQNARTSAQFVT